MKTILLEKYGSPLNLKIKEIQKPIPKEKEVLVRIVATTINDYDWSLVTGKPKIYKLMFGFPKPKKNIPGMELSGIVEEIGSSVTKFKVGDEVFGDISDHGFGTFAEYISISEEALVKKPSEISFEEAATMPHAALLALQGFEMAGIGAGQDILINGACGGVGTFALQIAKRYNCNVTGVDSSDKFHKMEELGYDKCIDYRKQDFTKLDKKYDIILDCKTNRSPFKYAKALKKGGVYVTVGGRIFSLIKVLLLGFIIKTLSDKSIKILPLKANQGMQTILKMNKESKFNFNIDGPFKFEEIPKLIGYFGEAKHKGKITIKINGNL